MFVNIRSLTCSPSWNPSKVSLITISARMLIKQVRRKETTLSKAFWLCSRYFGLSDLFPVYSLARMSIKCRVFIVTFIVTYLHWRSSRMPSRSLQGMCRVVAGARVPCTSVFWDSWFGLLSSFVAGISPVRLQFRFGLHWDPDSMIRRRVLLGWAIVL